MVIIKIFTISGIEIQEKSDTRKFIKKPDDFDNGYVVDVHRNYNENTKNTPRFFHVCLENEVYETFSTDFLRSIKPLIIKPQTKVKCDWIDKYETFVYKRNWKVSVNYGRKVTKTNRIKTFKQKPFLKYFIDLKTKLRSRTFGNRLRKRIPSNIYYWFVGETMENPRKRNYREFCMKL